MVAENISKIRASLPEDVTLVAVSKTKPVADLMEAYGVGQRDFGENYPLELRDKHSAMPPDVRWHFLGHIQSKQIKYYIDFVSLIHGVDSADHLADINAAAAKVGRVVDCLLEFHIATEATKAGFVLPEAEQVLQNRSAYPNVRLRGVMGMATNTDDQTLVSSEFANLKAIFNTLKNNYFNGVETFNVISMGMSHDYRLAVEAGSTMVRIGSSIFGPRVYANKA